MIYILMNNRISNKFREYVVLFELNFAIYPIYKMNYFNKSMHGF